ncbi:MAG: hypothetical protein K0B37_03460 [Bacteroidales bacterium]|nr:hypothetical protein [Bacteroidales bacterium]
MEKINQFSVQRLFLLMKRHSIMNLKTWLIGFGAISGVLIVMALLQSLGSGTFNLDSLTATGISFIFIAGYLITSMMYNEIHTPARGQFYLILPATTFEKLLSNWLLSSIVYVLVAHIMLSLVLLIAGLLSAAIFSTSLDFYNPFTEAGFKNMGVYLVTQSIFFLGALYFRKNNMLKTLLSIFAVIVALGMIASLFGWIILGEFNQINEENLPPQGLEFFTITIPNIAKYLFWGLTAPFFLVVSYFKLKEREV